MKRLTKWWQSTKDWLRDSVFVRLFILFVLVPILSTILLLISIVRVLAGKCQIADKMLWRNMVGVSDPAMFAYWQAIWNPDADDGHLGDRLINMAEEHARNHPLPYVVIMSALLVLEGLV
jgi:hypothetical protein